MVLENDLTYANHASLPVIPSASVAYNSQLGHAEPDVTTAEPKDPSGLEHIAATLAPSAFLSEEEFAVLVRHLNIHGRIRFVPAFLYATYIVDFVPEFRQSSWGKPLLPTSQGCPICPHSPLRSADTIPARFLKILLRRLGRMPMPRRW